MKKIVLTLAALASFTFASAQEGETSTFGFGEGNILLEGNLGFNSTNDKNTEEKTSHFEINPKVGYFISDDFAIGVELAYSSDKEEDPAGEVTANTFGAGAFGRYYFLDLGERFKTYGELGAGFVSTKQEMGGMEAKANGFGVGLGLGMNYFVTESFAINFALSDVLSYTSAKADEGEAVTEFNGNINVFNNFFTTAQFGLTFKF